MICYGVVVLEGGTSIFIRMGPVMQRARQYGGHGSHIVRPRDH
jgi:hypothetical protein